MTRPHESGNYWPNGWPAALREYSVQAPGRRPLFFNKHRGRVFCYVMGNMPDNVVPLRGNLPKAELGERTDDELVRLTRGGYAPAFSILVARHSARLIDFCGKMSGQLRLGEDIAQDTWLAVHRHLGAYEPRGRFTAYVLTVARNRCRNAQRGKRAVPLFAGEEELLENPSPGQLDQLLAREQQNELFQRVAQLKHKLREAIVLRFAVGLDYDQISEITGRSESTMRSRVFHGLKALRKQLSRSEP